VVIPVTHDEAFVHLLVALGRAAAEPTPLGVDVTGGPRSADGTCGVVVVVLVDTASVVVLHTEETVAVVIACAGTRRRCAVFRHAEEVCTATTAVSVLGSHETLVESFLVFRTRAGAPARVRAWLASRVSALVVLELVHGNLDTNASFRIVLGFSWSVLLAQKSEVDAFCSGPCVARSTLKTACFYHGAI
jgi:hypothetical protein